MRLKSEDPAEPPGIENPSESLRCDFYDSRECASCQPQPIICEKSGVQTPACFAAWTVSGANETTLLHKGCWEDHGSVKSCFTGQVERCAAGRPHKQPDIRGHNVYFCCCRSPMCNLHYEYDPSMTTIDGDGALFNTSLLDASNPFAATVPLARDPLQNVLYAFASVLIVTLISIFAYFAYRKLHMKQLIGYDSGEQLKHWSKDKRPGKNERKKSSIELIEMIAKGRYSNVWLGRYALDSNCNNGSATHNVVVQAGNPKINNIGQSCVLDVCNDKPRSDEIEDVSGTGIRNDVDASRSGNSNDGAKTALLPNTNRSRLVAVKIFLEKEVKNWAEEYEVFNLAAMRHCENVLLFLESVERSPDEYWLITEYHSNGSIYNYLQTNTITLGQLLHISRTMLNGLAFLHEEVVINDQTRDKPTIVHRDFKSRNVLLKHDLTACIADFGLALQCRQGRTPSDTHKQVGTRRYMAPEVLETATEYSAFAFKQIDVYAAALVLWELLSRCEIVEGQPVAQYQAPYEKELGPEPRLIDLCKLVVIDRNRPELEPLWRQNKLGDNFCRTVEEMWDHEPEARITARCALERIRGMQLAFERSPISDISSASFGQILNEDENISLLPVDET